MTIRLVITVSGNSVNTHQDDNAAPVERPLTDTSLPTPRMSHPASDRTSILQATAEAETAEGSEGFAQVNPQLAHHMDQLPRNGASVATSATTGLKSSLSNLDGIVQIVNLLTDVCKSRSHLLLSWLMFPQVHPLVKGAWSLVNAAYEIARTQADLDTSIETLIDAMDDSCKLAKEYAPLTGCHSHTDSVVRDLLREVIKGANLVKVYCKKRPKSECVMYRCPFC